MVRLSDLLIVSKTETGHLELRPADWTDHDVTTVDDPSTLASSGLDSAPDLRDNVAVEIHMDIDRQALFFGEDYERMERLAWASLDQTSSRWPDNNDQDVDGSPSSTDPALLARRTPPGECLSIQLDTPDSSYHDDRIADATCARSKSVCSFVSVGSQDYMDRDVTGSPVPQVKAVIKHTRKRQSTSRCSISRQPNNRWSTNRQSKVLWSKIRKVKRRKYFPCREIGCDWSFTRMFDLKRHLNTHLGTVEQSNCRGCGKVRLHLLVFSRHAMLITRSRTILERTTARDTGKRMLPANAVTTRRCGRTPRSP